MYGSRMLHEFLTTNRNELIERCREKVARRPTPKASPTELEHGIPLFLDQLIKTLQAEQKISAMEIRAVSGPSGGKQPNRSEMGLTATLHGRELLEQGCTIDQVVHDYGDLCQAVTELAFEDRASIQVEEFRTLNRCLDNAIADAVTEFSFQRDSRVAGKSLDPITERRGILARELMDLVQKATLAVTAIKAGRVGLAGATGIVLDHSLVGLRDLVEKSFADVLPPAA